MRPEPVDASFPRPAGVGFSPRLADHTDRSTSVGARRAAIAAALRAVRDEPVTQPQPAAVTAPATPVATSDDVVRLLAEVRRLGERLERLEEKVDLLREEDETPLPWPTPVTNDTRLEVPPLEVSRKSSPAFDVLLGPPPAAPVAARRDTA